MLCYFCLGLLSSLKRDVCEQCRSKVGQNKDSVSFFLESGEGCLSLFHYSSFARQLMAMVKIRSSYVIMAGMFHLGRQSQSLSHYLDGVDVIVPVPSSLWGRCRGKVDMASSWATWLSHEFGVLCHHLPRSFYFWRWRKRSLIKVDRRLKHDECDGKRNVNMTYKFGDLLNIRDENCTLRVLLVDDIVTTGASLATVSRALRGRNVHVKCLTLFAAGSFLGRD